MKSAFASASIVLAAAVLSEVPSVHAAYNLVRSWEGQTFFSGWDFYGSYDNLTNVSLWRFDWRTVLNPKQGDAIWVNQSLATSDNLAYVDSNGKAIIRVDNVTNVLYNDKRNTVSSISAVNKEIIDLKSPSLGSNHDPGFVPSWKRVLA
jgi:hypothetical protein